MIRSPAVAGTFYPGSPDALGRAVDELLGPKLGDRTVRAVVAPHAGYVYSGKVAGEVYSRIRVPDVCIVVCPNHTGTGSGRSLNVEETWRTPLGDVAVDTKLAGALLGKAGLTRDTRAHSREHALEVQLPFLQRKNPRVRIVPICLAGISVDGCEQVGEAVAEAVSSSEEDVLLVASTDMSHYVPADDAARLDRLAIDAIERVDPRGLYDTVVKNDLSMCGFIPTTVVLAAARALGASCAELVRYGHSGETSGDYGHVVGYAALVVP